MKKKVWIGFLAVSMLFVIGGNQILAADENSSGEEEEIVVIDEDDYTEGLFAEDGLAIDEDLDLNTDLETSNETSEDLNAGGGYEASK